MAMEVKFSNYDYQERLQESKDKTKEAPKEQGAGEKNEGIPVPKDEYISSEQSGRRQGGLYRMGKDEKGNPKVLYDDPGKCTANTDKVDREIEKLKEQKRQLEQQIEAASGEEEKVRELEKKLSRIEGELSRKDNDTYRRQKAVIS